MSSLGEASVSTFTTGTPSRFLSIEAADAEAARASKGGTGLILPLENTFCHCFIGIWPVSRTLLLVDAVVLRVGAGTGDAQPRCC